MRGRKRFRRAFLRGIVAASSEGTGRARRPFSRSCPGQGERSLEREIDERRWSDGTSTSSKVASDARTIRATDSIEVGVGNAFRNAVDPRTRTLASTFSVVPGCIEGCPEWAMRGVSISMVRSTSLVCDKVRMKAIRRPYRILRQTLSGSTRQ